MTDVKLDVLVPEELLDLLGHSRFFDGDRTRLIRVALAIHLFIAEEISLGKAAELSGEQRGDFEDLLIQMEIPLVRYDEHDLAADLKTLRALNDR